MSAARRWTGRSLSGVAVLFLLLDGLMKVARAAPAMEATTRLGYPEGSVPIIGVLVLAGVALHLVPATSVLGALWLTAFLGGAASANFRVEAPWLSHVLFPAYLCALMWIGLVLRRPALWSVIRPGTVRGEASSVG